MGLVDAELDARTKYAAPSVPGLTDAPANPGEASLAGLGYNYDGGLPVKYDVPSVQKERMQMRQAVRKAAALEERPAGAANVVRTDPITDEEVNYLASMKDQAELADFDRYVNKLIDPRKPGNLKWLMEIYPEYVNRRIQQVHTDYEFALRNQMIDSWGINTFGDLHFKYLVDQGKVDGPRLQKHTSMADEYAPGLLSPWTFLANGDNREGKRLRLPFASAKFGKRPGDGANDARLWELDERVGRGKTMSRGRGTQELANSMYNPGARRDRDLATAGGPAVRPVAFAY
jgi:hypothetical protein